MSVPDWTSEGLLPPIRTRLGGATHDRSPYHATTLELVLRFATTPERWRILDGLLRYREVLYGMGMSTGWQWIDGSLLEEVEVLEDRPPNDVDVVTFFELPTGKTPDEVIAAGRGLFGSEKPTFQVDAYYFQLGLPTGRFEVEWIAYWYSMWSHRRTGAWKGFLQVGLDPAGDEEARVNLAEVIAEGGAA